MNRYLITFVNEGMFFIEQIMANRIQEAFIKFNTSNITFDEVISINLCR